MNIYNYCMALVFIFRAPSSSLPSRSTTASNSLLNFYIKKILYLKMSFFTSFQVSMRKETRLKNPSAEKLIPVSERLAVFAVFAMSFVEFICFF